MKSPEIVTQIKIEKIPQYVDRPKIVEVTRPHNCVLPLPVPADSIQNTDDAILYLNREYRVKYLACLDSL